ncbi:hypothetical protein ACN1NW_000417 [Acinetobacter baumannii]|nr:hypothetical protein [Acinetobacter baumannii]ELA7031006.1 hypothetical protein [Acinetobacter baumannii]ELA7118769.1 hypothetical protein [Acinetobacter baumannii]ELB0919718.1 hypothetical protein [Acinetobacter baumannii]ELB0965894.1 hypothetical protein [Acinetobacter baumannii]
MKEYQIKVIRMEVITVRAISKEAAFDYAEDPKNFPPNSELFDAHLISEEEIKDKPL